MKTTLIILNYNDGERTKGLLLQAAGYDVINDIVVVDNASTDGSYELLKEEEGEHIHVIRRNSNGGYAKGNNEGALYALKKLHPDIIFIANPDVSFTEPAAKAMAEALMNNNEYAAVAPFVRQGYNVWNLPGFIGILRSLFLFSFTAEKILLKKAVERTGADLAPVGVIEGSFFAVSAEKFREVSGFDERTFLYGEEIMLARRFRRKGYREAVLPKMVYDHLHSASIKKIYRSSKAAAFHHFRDSFRIYNKYYLKTGSVEDRIFDLCWQLGLMERKIYDIIKNHIR
ncbi:MAG: glycosyltransferase family 2 protein [Lachnospiraceae bacterium]|nr:glycosyltransferase family 2 protein [Lachnospiraceae bacterium]